MRAWIGAAALVGLVACAGDPTCEEAVNHLVAGRLLPAELKAARVGLCERARPSRKMRACVIAASTPEAVDDCACDEAYPDEPLKVMHRSPQATEERLLQQLADNVRRAYDEHGQFPATSAGPVPSIDAICAKGGVTPPEPARWRDAPWDALHFTVDDPVHAGFQYQVTDPTREATVRAVFDLDCDGVAETAQITIRVEHGEATLGPLDTAYPANWTRPPRTR